MGSGYLDKCSLKNKTVLIIGGGGLLGKELVRQSIQSEAKVILADLSKPKQEDLTLSKSDYERLTFFYLDCAKTDSLEHSFEKIASVCPEIDVLINAAFPRLPGWKESPDSISVKGWQDNINAHMNFYCLSSFWMANYLKNKKKAGNIVNISSVFSKVGQKKSLYENTDFYPAIPYAAIKGGINAFSKFLAAQFGEYQIRVNVIIAGGIEREGMDAKFKQNFENNTLLKRLARSSEIATATLFLASEAASYITGAEIVVDGGWTAI